MKKKDDPNMKDENQEKWENGELGKDINHAKAIYIDSKKTLPTSMRLSHELIKELKILSEESGIPYQTYVKMILTKHVRSEKLKKSA